MKYFVLCALVLSACSEPVRNSVITAQPYIGLEERANRSEIRELEGVDPVRTEWCAAFVNSILEIDGIPNLNDQSQYPPLMARSFLHWGEPVLKSEIRRGDVVVYPIGTQGWQGHVGFYVEEQNGYWVILGGNQDQSVNYQLYDPRRAIAVRRSSQARSLASIW